MATQRLVVTAIAGAAGSAAFSLFARLRALPGSHFVDDFCERLRANCTTLPVVYYCEWIDRWLMGDSVLGPQKLNGNRYQVDCMSPEEAVAWASQCGDQFEEQHWLAARLLEAATAWQPIDPSFIFVIRDVLGGSDTEEEVTASLGHVPSWLQEACGSTP